MALTKTTVTKVTAEILTVAGAKSHLRIEADFTDDDDDIASFIAAAEQEVVALTGRFIEQKCVLEYDRWCDDMFEVPAVRDAVLTKVEYMAEGGTTYAELAAENYEFTLGTADEASLMFLGDALPTLAANDAAVKVTITTSVPKMLVHAVKLKVAELYDIRNNAPVGNNTAFDRLCRLHRTKW